MNLSRFPGKGADELSRLVTLIVEYLYVVPAGVKRARDGRAP